MTAYNIVNPGSLVGGQPEDVGQVLANFQAIAGVINGSLDWTNLGAGAGIQLSQLGQSGAGSGQVPTWSGSAWAPATPSTGTGGGPAAPTGTVLDFAGQALPAGFLWCDGSAVSRTTYAALYAVIGTLWGPGDGSQTFNLPDLRGRVAVGWAQSGGHADVSLIGANEGSLLPNRRPRHPHTSSGFTLPPHVHSFNDPGHGHGLNDPGHAHGAGSLNVDTTNLGLVNTGGGSPSADVDRDSGTAYAAIGGSTAGAGTGLSIAGNGTGISVGNPTTNPPIAGSVGVDGTAPDSEAYIVIPKIIKV